MITRRLARPLASSSSTAWMCPTCTRASLPRNPIQTQARRGLQQRPLLTHDASFQKSGIPGLLSPGGYQIAWTHYEKSMINKLNELLAGETDDKTHMKDLVIRFARNPMTASIFNHASMAHNNHFFFGSFSTAPRQLDHHGALKRSLEVTFGSVETLKATFLDSASAMFGPGFVWLVWARDLSAPGGVRSGSWRILNTYLAGTPYPEAGYRQQGMDMNTSDAGSFGQYKSGQPVNTVGTFGPWARSGKDQAKMPPGGTHLMPVLCVNTWEHVWLRDYGMDGKRVFLKDWWDCVDWSVVESRAPKEAIAQVKFERT